tara:strand:- start:156 stop:380 length:225 start_codon:yes stop_codon:yes gene_type:complete
MVTYNETKPITNMALFVTKAPINSILASIYIMANNQYQIHEYDNPVPILLTNKPRTYIVLLKTQPESPLNIGRR